MVLFWREWNSKGIEHIQCIYHNNVVIKSIEELKEPHNL